MKLQQVLDLIDAGDLALPEFQRGYVWNREQVRSLLASLYRGYPIGAFMTWHTRAEGAVTRGGSVKADGTVKLILDGQQRVTTLYGVIRGRAPEFFEGSAATFTGLHFHLDDEVFEFYAPSKMKDNPAWVEVTTVMRDGLGPFMPSIQIMAGRDAVRLGEYVNRLNRIGLIAQTNVHIEEVTGEDKTIDVVVDIFNRVNSGGTKLSKGGLALAKVCASWPEARQEMNAALRRWSQTGYNFRLEWLLRNVNAVVTGEALFSAFARVGPTDFRAGLTETTSLVSHLLDIIAARLGLDHDRVLFGRFAFPVMARFLHAQGGRFADITQQNQLLYWYVHAALWGRYAGSTETVLNQDLDAVDRSGLDGLVENMRASRGDLVVRPADFAGYSVGARFYPMLYLLTRVLGARDFESGIPLSAQLLGPLASLQVHHIFPKARLYPAGYRQADVNAVANFCFLTQFANLEVGADDPAVYFHKVESRHPGALASQWIPMDPDLWRVDRYLDFLEARRQLLADAANGFLNDLLAIDSPPLADVAPVRIVPDLPDDQPSPDVQELLDWLRGLGLVEPEVDVEVTEPSTGTVLAVAEAFWPNGLQEGLGQPVVLELDPGAADEDALASLGYLVFTTVAALREYVERGAGLI